MDGCEDRADQVDAVGSGKEGCASYAVSDSLDVVRDAPILVKRLKCLNFCPENAANTRRVLFTQRLISGLLCVLCCATRGRVALFAWLVGQTHSECMLNMMAALRLQNGSCDGRSVQLPHICAGVRARAVFG